MRQEPTKFLILAAILFCLAPAGAQAEIARFAEAADKFQLQPTITTADWAREPWHKGQLDTTIILWKYARKPNLPQDIKTTRQFQLSMLETSHDVMRQYRETLVRRSVHPALLKLFDDALAWAKSFGQKSMGEVYQFAMEAKAKAAKIQNKDQKDFYLNVSEKLIQNLKKLRHKPIIFETLKKGTRANTLFQQERAWIDMHYLADAGDYAPAQLVMYDYYSQESKKKQIFAYYWLKRAERNGTDVTIKIESLSKTLKGKVQKRADLWLKLYRYPVWKKDKAIPISADLIDEKEREPTPQTLGDYLRNQKRVEDDDLLTYTLKDSLAYFKGTRSKNLDRAQNIIAAKMKLRSTALYMSKRILRKKRAYMVKERWPAEFISLFDAALDWQKALFQLDPNEVFSIFLILKKNEAQAQKVKVYELADGYGDLADGIYDLLEGVYHLPALFYKYEKGFFNPGPLRRALSHHFVWQLVNGFDYVPAQLALVERYRNGQDSVRNPAKALYWFAFAQNFGAKVAQPLRELRSRASQQDYKKAADWITKNGVPGL